MSLISTACGKRRPSACPIDGSPAQVTRRLDEKPCAYSHFSVVGRNTENTWFFIEDLQERLAGRVQLTTDGFRPSLNAVDDAFGIDVDYAMLIKTYQESSTQDRRYSPGQFVNALPIPVTG